MTRGDIPPVIMRGHGTNFHSVYGNLPAIYDAFSVSEVFDSELSGLMGNLLHGTRLLDVAAGTGEKTKRYASRFKSVVALDKSEALASYGTVHNRTDNMNFVVGTASSMPFPDGSFDRILTTWGSFTMAKAVPEMKRVLSKGGKIIRIGTCEKDGLTSLFPSFSLRRVSAVNRSYRNRGFFESRHKVIIEFSSLKVAKKILGAICGCNPDMVISRKIIHEVALHVYRKH